MSTTEDWSGSPCPKDPDNFWIDDKTGERVNAQTGERTPPADDDSDRPSACPRG